MQTAMRLAANADLSAANATLDELATRMRTHLARKPRPPRKGEYEAIERIWTIRPLPEPIVQCDKCHDAGVVKKPNPAGKYGGPKLEDRYELVTCSCKADEYAERKALRIKSASSLTPEMERMTFASYDRGWDEDAYQAAWALVHPGSEDLPVPPFLVLSGQYGSGKTHLLAAIANDFMAQGRQPLFVVVPRLMDWLRAGFDLETADEKIAFQQRLDGICDADILLLDDMGAEKDTAWTRDKLFQILNHRYARRLTTVVSTNCLPRDFDGRIADRLSDVAVCEVVFTVDKSYRQQQGRMKQRVSSKKKAS